MKAVQRIAKENGAFDAVICQHWAKGGAGAVGLAEAVEKATQQSSNFKFLYDLQVSLVYILSSNTDCIRIKNYNALQ